VREPLAAEELRPVESPRPWRIVSSRSLSELHGVRWLIFPTQRRRKNTENLTGRLVLPDPAIAPLWQMRGEGAKERQVIW
jgi:hypothetical protein